MPLSEIQCRFQFLTQHAGLEYGEALHALGSRRGAWLKNRNLTRLEQYRKIQEYLERGLTNNEAHQAVGLTLDAPNRPSKIRKPKSNKPVPTLDWMPAVQAQNAPTPGRSKKGLLK